MKTLKNLLKKYGFEDTIANIVFALAILLFGVATALVLYLQLTKFFNL
jgi:hypothetical protein